MGFMISEGLANIAVKAITDELAGGTIKIYGHADSQVEADALIPDSASDSIGSALELCEITVDPGLGGLTFESTASGGIVAKSTDETWLGVVSSSGYASFYRFILGTDTGVSSTTEIRGQGTVGVVGKDLIIADAHLVATNEQRIDSFVIGQPMG